MQTYLTNTETPTSCILEAQHLKKSFGGQKILDDVSIQLHKGEVVLLRGENGSGKTTLLNILTGNIEPDAGSIHYLADDTPRTYYFPRSWWQDVNPIDHFTPEFIAHEAIGRTWQDIRLFGSQSLHNNIAVAAPNHPGENPILALFAPRRSAHREAEISREADAMLARLGLQEHASSSADKISLGQSKRVAIARAVAAKARILFLDEPLTGLDSRGISETLSLLDYLIREEGLTLIIVEHVFNQSHFRGLVTTDWLLDNGKLRVSTVIPIQKSEFENGWYDSDSHPAWFLSLAGEGADITEVALARGAFLTRIRRPGRFPFPPKPVLEIRDLVVNRGSRTVIGLDDQHLLSGFDLTINEGEIAILQAPNGWGKSTFIAAVCGLIPTERGEIILEGKSLGRLSAWERVHRGLRALPADQHTFPSLLGREVLRLAGNPDNSQELDAFINLPCSSLSGGQKQKLALSCMPVGIVNLYDEPISAMDTAVPLIRRCISFEGPHKCSLVLIPSAKTLND